MYKSKLNGDQMSAVEYVDRAAGWSRELTRMRARGPGDTENAMRSIERDYAVDYWVQWRLRYRPTQIKALCVSVYARLEAAYHSECERQRRRLEIELQNTKAKVGSRHPAVVKAEAVVGETEVGPEHAPSVPPVHRSRSVKS